MLCVRVKWNWMLSSTLAPYQSTQCHHRVCWWKLKSRISHLDDRLTVNESSREKQNWRRRRRENFVIIIIEIEITQIYSHIICRLECGFSSSRDEDYHHFFTLCWRWENFSHSRQNLDISLASKMWWRREICLSRLDTILECNLRMIWMIFSFVYLNYLTSSLVIAFSLAPLFKASRSHEFSQFPNSTLPPPPAPHCMWVSRSLSEKNLRINAWMEINNKLIS